MIQMHVKNNVVDSYILFYFNREIVYVVSSVVRFVLPEFDWVSLYFPYDWLH